MINDKTINEDYPIGTVTNICHNLTNRPILLKQKQFVTVKEGTGEFIVIQTQNKYRPIPSGDSALGLLRCLKTLRFQGLQGGTT